MRRNILPLLAFYLDFIIAHAFVTLAGAGLARAGIALADYGGVFAPLAEPGKARLAGFGLAALLVLVFRRLNAAPGTWLVAVAGSWWGDPARPRLWPNLLLGTFFVLDGLKQAVRWSQLDAVLPVFGLLETGPLKIAVLLAMGALYIASGAMLLRLAPRARLAGLAALAASAVSLVMSLPVLPEGLARAQAARRAAQGLPMREGEIESLQAMLPWALGLMGLLLVLLYFASERPAGAKL